MAETNAPQSTARKTTLLMIAALVAIGGLFWWLSVTAEPTQISILEDTASVPGANIDGGAANVTVADFATGPEGFQSLNIRLSNVTIASTLGGRAFWIQLPNNQPYMIRISDALAAGGASFANGDIVTVSGIVELMSDSVLTDWRSSGALVDDLQVEEARFALSFLDARTLN
ncbi:MAG: hypothetical protein ABFS34_07425 [Gemmatimonadota bacterium]